MRKRIQRLAQGRFDGAQPSLSFSSDKIELEVIEGQKIAGTFTITVSNQVPAKGIIYTSNPYMECLTPEFEGTEATIAFQFHSEGFHEGDIQKGEFYVICNQAEYNLSFVVSVTKPYANSSVGRIRTLKDFARLAQTDYMEAFRIYASVGFRYILKEQDVTEQLLYEGLGRGPATLAGMEEFLVAINAKKEVRLKLAEEKREIIGILETEKEAVSIQKDGWGFAQFTVRTEDAFLRLERDSYTMEDFVGSICEIPYFIEAERLHGGRNFGRIVIQSAYQRLEYTVVVRREIPVPDELRTVYREKQQALKCVAELYLDYRLKRIGAGLWAAKTIEQLMTLSAMEPEEDWYLLMKVQALLVSGQKMEAEWSLDEFRAKPCDKFSPLYAYYLYLCTLREREENYVNRLTGQIEDIYHETDDDRVFWMLLFLKKEYCDNETRKLRAIENRMLDGCNSPYLYIEAFYLYRKNPHLLGRLSEFEIRVLHWGAKRDALTGELAMQLATLSANRRMYQPLLYRTLRCAYAKYESTPLLEAVCSYLIRSQRFEMEYHKWFEQGIEAELRLTGLNEAYLMSMDLMTVKRIPRVIQMYFQYNSGVPYKHKAALMANIIAMKEEQPEVYHSYRKRMEEFALAQVAEGHMDDNLAILYTDVLDKGMITKQLAQPLAKILFTHKMNCFTSGMMRMHVIHRQLKQEQNIPIVNGVAYFQLYTTDYGIFFEDAYGNRYASGVSYQIERLMRPGMYYKTCMEAAPLEINYLLYHFNKSTGELAFVPEDKEYLHQLIQNDMLREDYRAKLYPRAIRFLERLDELERVYEYLQQVKLTFLSRSDRIYMIEQMIEYRLFEQACQCIREYGADGIRPERMVAVCGYEIKRTEYESDDFLINLCVSAFREGKYSEEILTYLEQYYCGPTRLMAQVWKAAVQFGVETGRLEERLLVQMLYTCEFVDNVQEIYDSYIEHGAARLLSCAYENYFAYFYFVKQGIVPGDILSRLKHRYLEREELTDIERLALLCGLVRDELPLKERDNHLIAGELLTELLKEQRYFGFFGEMPKDMQYRYHLYDRQYVEYRTTPGSCVNIHYNRDEVFVEEEMPEMYDGIYVKEFIVFFGDEIQYYISEEEGPKSTVTESGSIGCHDLYTKESQSRYDMLNAMEMQIALQDVEGLERIMRCYDRLRQVNDTRFRIM
ncbi:MAG: hypothetical protein K2N01_11765 [Lachnospiraceae bacterium]|nr:hypothetical protein [Lachnospiraceae bacterium]